MIEPVAYINVEERKLEWAKPVIWNTPTIWKLDKVPLYTHPVKELTDEEIISTMVQFDVYSSDDHLLIEAGRAILRKAQEK